MLGFTRDISKVATTPRLGQAACMMVGILIFFDDYANILLAGETMRPLLDVLSVSREKLSFIVDATSAPIASISPISSWVGFEVGLIQEAIDIIVKRNDPETIGGGGGGDVLQIPESGFAVFLNSLRYAYYSWFMLVFIALIIFFQRDSGPMLLAERKVRIYDRTDGGPGKGMLCYICCILFDFYSICCTSRHKYHQTNIPFLRRGCRCPSLYHHHHHELLYRSIQ